MIHTGIDMVTTSRMDRLSKDGRFVEKVCTQEEVQLIESHPRRGQKLAAIFSLKEAFSKAMGTGIGGELSFHDLEVSYNEKGQPFIEYVGERFSDKKSEWKVSCSVSHEGDFLISIVVIDGELS